MNNRGALAVRKRVIAKLVRGREVLTQLQSRIDKPVRDREAVDLEDLALQIFRSFSDSLSEISSTRANSTPISSAVDGGGISASSDERTKKPAVKNRRGCYKRRRTSDSRIVMSAAEEDGYAWRKYGQKDILNSEFPRCYYRCTHKQQGCKALKQVQKMKEDPILYQTTYINHHTCSYIHSSRPRYELVDQYKHQSTNIISFQSNTDTLDDHSPDPPTILPIDYNHDAALTPSLKEETDTQSDDHQDTKSDAKSSMLQDDWGEIMWSDAFGYSPIWEEGASCGSSSFNAVLGMEINGHFPDIETFHFDD